MFQSPFSFCFSLVSRSRFEEYSVFYAASAKNLICDTIKGHVTLKVLFITPIHIHCIPIHSGYLNDKLCLLNV